MTEKTKPPRTQARRIFDLFGGAAKVQRALERAGRKRDLSSVSRWDLPRRVGGTGGLIPTRALADVAAAARLEGILLPSTAFDPREL